LADTARRQVLLWGGAALWACIAPAGLFAQTDVVEVVIRDYKYLPANITIKRGSSVRWVNKEKRTSHSVLFGGPGGFESERMLPDESYTHRFDTPGVYVYSCGPHPEMKGQIEVTP
jgi:plastocyanin